MSKKILTFHLPLGVTELCAIAATIAEHFPEAYMIRGANDNEAEVYEGPDLDPAAPPTLPSEPRSAAGGTDTTRDPIGPPEHT